MSEKNKSASVSLEQSFGADEIGLIDPELKSARELEKGFSSKKILIVEDCPETQLLESHLFEMIGFEAHSVSTGTECIEAVTRTLGSDREFEYIIMDIGLPEIDGISATRQLRQLGYQGVIIAVTAAPTVFDGDEARRAGVDYYFPKSAIRNEIIVLLRSLASTPTS